MQKQKKMCQSYISKNIIYNIRDIKGPVFFLQNRTKASNFFPTKHFSKNFAEKRKIVKKVFLKDVRSNFKC